MSNRIRIRRDTAAAWASANPILGLGEQGLETDTRKTKFGDGITAWNSLSYSVDKSQIGLGAVDNTSDASKPISSATQAALNTKADASSVYTKSESDSNYEPKSANIQAHIIDHSNPHSVTKAQVGLSNVDNTSDSSKPVSIATQSALDLKANASDVSSSLALKADASSVYTKSESDSIVSSALSSANSYTDTKTAAIVNSAPATLDTLNELASALGNDPNFATTTATLIGTKANSSDVYTKTQSDFNFEPKNSNIQSHISSISNPHSTTKAQVGLGNVDNTSDASKPISSATQTALDGKVDKIVGKGLSTEDFTTAEKSKLADIASGATANQTDAYLLSRANHTGSQTASTISDFTTAVQAVTIDASKIDGGSVSNAEFATLDGITTDVSIQSQINGKEPAITAGNSSQYYRGDKTFQTLDKTAVGLSNVDNVNAANLRDRSTHTGNETTLTFSEGSVPTAPASGLTIFAEGNGKQMLGQIPKVGRSYPFQPHLGQANVQIFLPNANVTTSTVIGQVAPTANGTATLRTVALTNSFVAQRRIGYVSAATANQSSGLRSAVLQFGLSNTASVGGFFFQTRFGISDAALVANARTFVGLVAQTTALGNADPSTVLNIIGMGHDSADANFSIMTNNGAGAANKIDLGTSFSRSPTVSSDMYDLILYAAPNSTTVYYQVTNMRTGVTVSGSTTTKVPVTNTLLTWQLWRQNGGTAAAVGIDIASVYVETEY